MVAKRVASAQDVTKAQPAFRPGKPGNVTGLSTVANRTEQSGASDKTQRHADKVAKAEPAAIVNQDGLFFRREKLSAKMPIEARARDTGSETANDTTSPSRTAHTASKFSTAIVC